MLAEEVTIIVTDLITREETVLAIAAADLRASSPSSTLPAELSELRAAKHNLFKLSQIPAALWDSSSISSQISTLSLTMSTVDSTRTNPAKFTSHQYMKNWVKIAESSLSSSQLKDPAGVSQQDQHQHKNSSQAQQS